MKHLSIKRVWNLMKFTVMSHKWFYLGLTLSSAVACGVILAFIAMDRQADKDDYAMTITVFGMYIMSIMAGVILACTYHPLRTKKNRINFMLLPASRCEKFLGLVLTNWAVLLLMCLLTLAVMLCFVPGAMEYLEISIDFKDAMEIVFAEGSYGEIVIMIAVLLYFFVLYPTLIVTINSLLYKNNIIPSAVIITVLAFMSIMFLDYIDVYYSLSRNEVSTLALLLELVSIGLCWKVIITRFKRMHICGIINK